MDEYDLYDSCSDSSSEVTLLSYTPFGETSSEGKGRASRTSRTAQAEHIHSTTQRLPSEEASLALEGTGANLGGLDGDALLDAAIEGGVLPSRISRESLVWASVGRRRLMARVLSLAEESKCGIRGVQSGGVQSVKATVQFISSPMGSACVIERRKLVPYHHCAVHGLRDRGQWSASLLEEEEKHARTAADESSLRQFFKDRSMAAAILRRALGNDERGEGSSSSSPFDEIEQTDERRQSEQISQAPIAGETKLSREEEEDGEAPLASDASLCSNASSLEEPYTQDTGCLDDIVSHGRKAERIRPGDVVTYFNPLYPVGDRRGRTEAVVLEVNEGRVNHRLTLANGDVLTDDTKVCRTKQFYKNQTIPHKGIFRPITGFVLKSSALDASLGGDGVVTEGERVAKIVRDGLDKFSTEHGDCGGVLRDFSRSAEGGAKSLKSKRQNGGRKDSNSEFKENKVVPESQDDFDEASMMRSREKSKRRLEKKGVRRLPGDGENSCNIGKSSGSARKRRTARSISGADSDVEKKMTTRRSPRKKNSFPLEFERA